MTIKTFALGGAAAVAFAGLISTAPALAHTSQPATPQEMQQTDSLNAKALQDAQGTMPANNNMAMPAPGTATAPGGATMTGPASDGDGNDAPAPMPGQSNAMPPADGTTPAPATTTNQ